ncbi:CAP domain-containing protein [Flagelloscypha sp. PMI_526]|nr:CAP domain-containing protein [Flagelloscypha sp. PMI_526]
MARFATLSLFFALAAVALAAPTDKIGQCSKDKVCGKLDELTKAGVDASTTRWGRMVASTGMSVEDFRVKVCGAKPTEQPKQEDQPKQDTSSNSNNNSGSNTSNNNQQSNSGSSNSGSSNSGSSNNNSGSSNSGSSNSGAGSSTASGDEARYLNFHNDLRAKHGAGKLTWDDGLAASAQAWANQCKFEHSQSGENLAAGTGSYSIEDALGSWAAEEPQYTGSFSSGAGHYTQMVWKGSSKLGCAVAPSCSGIFDSGVAKYYVCHYDPAGNVEGAFASNVS